MNRRDLIALIGGAAAWPVAARAQQQMPVIGYLAGASFESMRDIQIAAFHRGLADAGFVSGRNVAIEYRFAEGHNERLAALAAELVHLPVALIVAAGTTPGALAAKAATQTIPIAFLVGTDPVKVGLVPSLARPGGNITGVTNVVVELMTKCLEVAHQLVPPTTTMAVFINPANAPQAEAETRDVQDAARVLGARVVIIHASSAAEIEQAFATLDRERAGALVVSGETFFLTQSDLIVALAARHAVPAIYAYRESAVAGGLMSYGGSITDEHRQGGVYAGRILKGEKPSDLPVQQSTKVELVINLKTAKTLGITVPLPLLGRADEVIE
jgi:putative tryptophan/tyrosine transport system substrate-binding protein